MDKIDAITAVGTPDNGEISSSRPHHLHIDNISKISSNSEKEHQSSDTIEPVIKTTYSSSGGFDVLHVYEAFLSALRESQNPKSPIGTQEYINGYRELAKFFDQLGIVFKFVKDDVVQKLTILQGFVDKDNGDKKNFDTIQKAIDYETANNLIKTNSNNFARTLLRLHRALIFIEELLRGLSDRPLSDSTATVAASAYDSTLYNHHGIIVRTTVKVGFHALPSRKQLDEVIFHGHKGEMMEQYKTFIKTIKQIYDSIEIYYTEKNYLQLP